MAAVNPDEVSKPQKALCDVQEVAKWLLCSERQVQLLVQKGLPKEAHGQYDLLEVFKWYVQYLADKKKDDDENGLEKEQERWTKAKADLSEIELSKARGELVPIEVYETQLASQIMAARQHILGLPAKLSPQLEGETRLVIRAKLSKGINECLLQLSTSAPDLVEVPKEPAPDGDSDGNPADSGTQPSGDDRARKRGRNKRGKQKAAAPVGAHARTKHRGVGRKKSDT